MKYLFNILAIALIINVCSCNDNKIFEAEMYKKVFALVSNDDYNIMSIEHDLDKPEDIGYIAISCGGTNPTEKDINITMMENTDLFNRYNKNSFDHENEYAKLVPSGMYSIDNFEFKLPAGEKSAKLPIAIRPEGLSPDSTYFISLKIDSHSDYAVNPAKSDILYRPLLKNFWAAQKSPTIYRLRGVFNNANIIGNKRLFPLTHNQTRANVGNVINFTAEVEKINTESVILEVEKQQGEKIVLNKKYNVTVKPYKDISIIEPEEVDPDFPNIFYIEDDGFKTFKTFLIHYLYQLDGSSTIYEMKEELRMEFVYKEDI